MLDPFAGRARYVFEDDEEVDDDEVVPPPPPFQARQGDVFLIAVQSIPEHARPLAREQGRIVLAYGEATGHAHAVRGNGATLVADGDERYLRVASAVTLDHEEHAAIEVPPGTYRVVIQREYVPAAVAPSRTRRVVD